MGSWQPVGLAGWGWARPTVAVIRMGCDSKGLEGNRPGWARNVSPPKTVDVLIYAIVWITCYSVQYFVIVIGL